MLGIAKFGIVEGQDDFDRPSWGAGRHFLRKAGGVGKLCDRNFCAYKV
jgi:hypothetical protein